MGLKKERVRQRRGSEVMNGAHSAGVMHTRDVGVWQVKQGHYASLVSTVVPAVKLHRYKTSYILVSRSLGIARIARSKVPYKGGVEFQMFCFSRYRGKQATAHILGLAAGSRLFIASRRSLPLALGALDIQVHTPQALEHVGEMGPGFSFFFPHYPGRIT